MVKTIANPCSVSNQNFPPWASIIFLALSVPLMKDCTIDSCWSGLIVSSGFSIRIMSEFPVSRSLTSKLMTPLSEKIDGSA